MLKKSLFISILIGLSFLSSESLFNQSVDFSTIEISQYNEKNEIESIKIENYSKKNQLINSENYIIYKGKQILDSTSQYIYDAKGLLKEEFHRTPNISFIYKYSSYKYGKVNNQYFVLEKTTLNYINNAIEVTNYKYDNKLKLKNESITTSTSSGKSIIYEKEYSYNEKGVLIKTIEYNDTDGNIYDATYTDYIYDKSGKLIELKSFDCNKKPLNITKISYNTNEKVFKEEIYKAEIVLSEDNTFFEQRFVKIKTVVYNYKWGLLSSTF